MSTSNYEINQVILEGLSSSRSSGSMSAWNPWWPHWQRRRRRCRSWSWTASGKLEIKIF